ncbi:MAG: glycoside hydrolase family 16 protein [Pseudomonadota bacterium]
MLRLRSVVQCALSISAACVVASCVDNGREQVFSQVDTVAPAAPATQSNQNISNPTLNVPMTLEVSPGDTLTLVWSDEFDGSALDPEVWFFATGDGTEAGLPGGWGNNELQYYLPDSAQLANGVLQITARRESFGGLNYTSARINTQDRFAFRYGRIEASIKLPAGQGVWPAFWMLSQDSPYGTWAATGEIDIMEAVNLDGTGGNEIFGTLHYGAPFPGNVFTSVTYIPSEDVTDDFHRYAIEWDATEIRWYFDDTLYATQNSWSSTAAPYPAPFDQNFHILLNVAVGGNLPGVPNADTVFPVTMEVDYVRVYSGE